MILERRLARCTAPAGAGTSYCRSAASTAVDIGALADDELVPFLPCVCLLGGIAAFCWFGTMFGTLRTCPARSAQQGILRCNSARAAGLGAESQREFAVIAARLNQMGGDEDFGW